MKEKTERKAFKDWFDGDAARRLGTQMQSAWPDFPVQTFEKLATRNLSTLEFHGRVGQFSDALAATLPDDRVQALEILTRSLPPILPDAEAVTDGWLQWPLGQFIADHGLPEFDASMRAMIELTQRFSSEFAVRPFVEQQPESTFARLRELATHPSPHVRRWCSEGVRPRLPWGKKLHALVKDPSPIWPILEILKDDPETYVQRSVANCLNDIAKDHPEAVLERCRTWQTNAGPERTWIIRHALRSLIKSAHPEALDLMGYPPNARIETHLSADRKTLRIGESVQLEATVHHPGKKSVNLMIDFVVSYVGKQGGQREKVFKWTTLVLKPGETRILQKKVPFRPATVRALYPGPHAIQLQINGTRQSRVELLLTSRTQIKT
ncbi:MAG: DNA alkylation repair protein [Verrucomicrobia bacterium]|nr:DNA alkylation repair protein [Verrucomicrobiota bacterium]MCH8513176.1 DNA alkylation repair protein [Kiritimatiellia bacterium]